MLVSVLSGKNDPSKKKQIDPFGDSLPVTGGERLVSVCAWVAVAPKLMQGGRSMLGVF